MKLTTSEIKFNVEQYGLSQFEEGYNAGKAKVYREQADRTRNLIDEYNKGYQDGKNMNYVSARNKGYEAGLNEAWECAIKVIDIWKNSSESTLCKELFGDYRIDEIMKKYTAPEAAARIHEYEEKQKNEIKIGDEIYSELTNTKAVVHRIDSWDRYQCFTDIGAQICLDKDTFKECWVKTGRYYPQIAEILEQMKEVEE